MRKMSFPYSITYNFYSATINDIQIHIINETIKKYIKPIHVILLNSIILFNIS